MNKRASRSTSTQFFGRSGEQGDVLRTKTTSKYISTSMTIGAAAAAPLPRIDWPGEDKWQLIWKHFAWSRRRKEKSFVACIFIEWKFGHVWTSCSLVLRSAWLKQGIRKGRKEQVINVTKWLASKLPTPIEIYMAFSFSHLNIVGQQLSR